VDPVKQALLSALEGQEVRWEDISPSLQGLKVEKMETTVSGAIAYGKTPEGALVVFAWTHEGNGPKTDCDELTSRVFEEALGAVSDSEAYQKWRDNRALVRGAVLVSKREQALIPTILFDEDVLEVQTIPSTPVIGATPTAFIFAPQMLSGK